MNKFDRVMQNLGAVAGRATAPVADSDIQRAEAVIGHELPSNYREFLNSYGGYHVMNGVLIPQPTLNGEDVAYVGVFYRIVPLEESSQYEPYDLLNGYINDRNALPSELITIASGDNGFICLALAGDNEGSVYFWNSREGDDPQGYSHMYRLSSSFEAFLDLIGR